MYSKFNLNVHEFVAFDTSAKHVNYQTMCRLETLALCEAERGIGEWERERKRVGGGQRPVLAKASLKMQCTWRHAHASAHAFMHLHAHVSQCTCICLVWVICDCSSPSPCSSPADPAQGRSICIWQLRCKQRYHMLVSGNLS